jgi:hypothetical protein
MDFALKINNLKSGIQRIMEYLQVGDFLNATFKSKIYGSLITEVINNQPSTDVRSEITDSLTN